MPYEMQWLVEKRVILTKFWGVVALQDLEPFTQDLVRHIDAGTPMVHHISDGLEIEKLDLSLRSLQLLTKTFQPNPRFGWQIEVTKNPINRMISSLAVQFSKIRYRTVATRAEAITFLRENEHTIEATQWDAATTQ